MTTDLSPDLAVLAAEAVKRHKARLRTVAAAYAAGRDHGTVEWFQGDARDVDVLRLRREMGREQWPIRQEAGDGWQLVRVEDDRITGSIIVSSMYRLVDRTQEWWIHASLSHVDADPPYLELTRLHRAVFGDNAFSYQVFVPVDEHYSFHDHCLHLFGRADGTPVLPDFRGPYGTV